MNDKRKERGKVNTIVFPDSLIVVKSMFRFTRDFFY